MAAFAGTTRTLAAFAGTTRTLAAFADLRPTMPADAGMSAAPPFRPKKPPRRDDRPRQVIEHTTELGNLIADLRRTLAIRQLDLAARVGVGRQWIGELEQGKPSLEIGLVLRTLTVLGLEIELKPTDPLPGWLTRARLAADAARLAAANRRRARRKGRRETARLMHVAANAPRVWPELE